MRAMSANPLLACARIGCEVRKAHPNSTHEDVIIYPLIYQRDGIGRLQVMSPAFEKYVKLFAACISAANGILGTSIFWADKNLKLYNVFQPYRRIR